MSYVELSDVQFEFYSFTSYTDGMFQSKFPFKDDKVLCYITYTVDWTSAITAFCFELHSPSIMGLCYAAKQVTNAVILSVLSEHLCIFLTSNHSSSQGSVRPKFWGNATFLVDCATYIIIQVMLLL